MRLFKYRKILSNFDNKNYIIESMILLEDESKKIIEIFHEKLGHIGINRLIFEIERRGLFINNIANEIQNVVKNCSICLTNKLNN